MKTLNAKRIATVAAGAALLGMGLAFAGSITFGNLPVVTNGQPMWQIVIGSSAKASDGVAAANLAAALGNLAFTTTPISASVNATQAQSVLGVQVKSASYKLSGQEVWLNESGGVAQTAGSYSFGALIGSVLNRALTLGVVDNTKYLQSGAVTAQQTYANPIGTDIITTNSPMYSPFTPGGAPTNGSVSAATNGGGVTFSSFTLGGADNILQIPAGKVTGLANGVGTYAETEYLWVTGFPVWGQGAGTSGAKTFELQSAGGAYEAVFGSAIPVLGTSGAYNNAQIQILGQPWVIINSTGGGSSSSVSQTTAVEGGSMYLGASLTNLSTVYVLHNITSGPFTVQVADLSYPDSNGISRAGLNIYYNGVLTNQTSLYPPVTKRYNVSGHILWVKLNQTFAGVYSYDKWAKLQLMSNVFKITDGSSFNSTNDPGWQVALWWVNTTGGTIANQLYAIDVWNTTPETLVPGGSISFIHDPADYKLTFTGSELSTASLDPVSLTVSNGGSTVYQNLGTTSVTGAPLGAPVTNITEPTDLLTVTSGIPNGFTYGGTQSSTVTYDLTPYELNEAGNALTRSGGIGAGSGANSVDSNVLISYSLPNNNIWISANSQLQITVRGHLWNTAGTGPASTNTTASVTFAAVNGIGGNMLSTGKVFYDINKIEVNKNLPGGADFMANVVGGNAIYTVASDDLAGLTGTTPGALYTIAGQSYDELSQTAAASTQYNNGIPTTWSLTAVGGQTTATTSQQYFTYSMNEIAVPSNTNAKDVLEVGIQNSTAGVGSGSGNLFYVNFSKAGIRNNVTYTPTPYTGGSSMSVESGFTTEKGSVVSSIAATSDSFGFAKTQDQLLFAVAPYNTTTGVAKYTEYGPYGIGQSTNIPNVTIANVKANISVSGTSNFTITGIGNIKATPSVSSADQVTLLKNLSSTGPIALLDSAAAAKPASDYILVGSGYVNSLSQQLQSQYNISVTPSGAPIVQAYGNDRILLAGYYANQTTAAVNNFIQQLYAQAST